MEWVVTTKELRQLMQRKAFEGYVLCEKCIERYTPCAALLLQNADGRVHILPVVYKLEQGEVCRSHAGWVCNGRQPKLRVGLFPWESGAALVAVHEVFDNPEFGKVLLRHYPELEGKPLTEELLEQVGCDLEVEIALWQLGNQ